MNNVEVHTQTISASNTSFVRLSAQKVKILAHNAMQEIETQRSVGVGKALEKAMSAQCIHCIPFTRIRLFRHNRYPSPEIAMAFDSEVQANMHMGHGDMSTCQVLMFLAEDLLSDTSLKEDDRYINVSLNDYRALT